MNQKILLLIFMVPLSVFTTDLYLASFQELSLHFSATPLQLQLSQSIYLGGFAIFTLLLAFLAEKIGCRRALAAGLFSYVIGTTLALLSSSIETFIAARLLQSIGGSSASILTRTMIRERFSNKESATIFSWMFFAVSVAMIMTPLIGSGLQHLWGWRANFLVLLTVGFIYFFAAFSIEEQRDSKTPPASFLSLFKQPIYCFNTLFTTVTWSSLMGFVALAPFLISFHYEFPPIFFGICYGLMMFFFICGNRCSKPKLRPGILFTATGTLLLMMTTWAPSLPLFLAAACISLFGVGYTAPQTQVRAITAIEGRTSYGFALMYFCMMLSSAVCGMLIIKYSQTPFWAAQVISLLGLIQLGLYFYKVRSEAETADDTEGAE